MLFTQDASRPQISMPNQPAARNQYDDVDEERTAAHDAKKESPVKPKIATAPKLESNSSVGWFGGIWSKLAPKPKNQMKLPDDKNPTVYTHKNVKNYDVILFL